MLHCSLTQTCGHGSPCPYKLIENIIKRLHERTPPSGFAAHLPFQGRLIFLFFSFI